MSIILDQLTKRYRGVPVVNNLSLEIADGEFFVLLGSSGSGKTTVLSIIAGLTEADQGRVVLHGHDVTYLPPQQRRIGFVFQQYALFQYMTVADNIEFGLSIRKVPKPERRRRRNELLELVGLAGLGERMPRQLSGGQQQRVALARALAHQPEALLLDEPLGALDAKIRLELRRTLRSIQRELGITTIFVTHDQDEAFELADRIGVMNFGRLLEVGPPQELYQQPQTEFVATFLGTANLLVGRRANGGVQAGPVQFPTSGVLGAVTPGERVQVLFRPEDVELSKSASGLDCPLLGQGRVEQIDFAGPFERLRLRLPPIQGVRPIAPPVAFGDDAILVETIRSQDQVNAFPLRSGQSVWVGVRRVHALAHLGLRFLLATDGSAQAQATIDLGGQMARLAHARTVLLGYGLKGELLQDHLQGVKERLGSGLATLEIRTTLDTLPNAVQRESEREPCDLVFLGISGRSDQGLVEQILQTGDHHVLVASRPHTGLEQALICVTSGESGKDDILFAGRLMRHLGAEITLLSVVDDKTAQPQTEAERIERFLSGGLRSLDVLGVRARTAIRYGDATAEIEKELRENRYDLLVLGAPLPGLHGEIVLEGVIVNLLSRVSDMPILLIRSLQS
ncbi:MAG: ATP-binding cassette domain-containing protein [Caldilineales bacterium]|nr:ATP-binding cassette domain-containing protein [Caldilineales bacterium]